MSNLNYSTEIGLQYGQLTPVADWCENNCKGEWTIKFNTTPVSNGNLYTFLFDSEEDYVNFLIWKK